jgi:glycine cleavage system T protein (aminomethyltransferase)
MDQPADLKRTPLHALHLELGAKMVPFAGYDMPVQYPTGILAEHLHTRAAAGLFDVSHMGQAWVSGARAAAMLESQTTADMSTVAPGRQRYTLFTTPDGGIYDDLMITNADDLYLVVVNAGCKDEDFARLGPAAASFGCRLEVLGDHALLALQGPAAAGVLEPMLPGVGRLVFLAGARFVWEGAGLFVTRSGYTGEDGFEISVPATHAERLARRLLARDSVKPIGLGARDSLRLEAGLCLYGHDIDRSTTPVEADLLWAIGKRRRSEGGFPGATRILGQITKGAPRRRVGVLPEGRAPIRDGTELTDAAGRPVGKITSGGFGPTVGGPIAMGYVETALAKPGTALNALLRGRPVPARVAPLPFVKTNYYRG